MLQIVHIDPGGSGGHPAFVVFVVGKDFVVRKNMIVGETLFIFAIVIW